MRYRVYTDARYIDGRVAAGRTLTIYDNEAATVLADIYGSATGDAISNPYTVPSTGIVDFWVDDSTSWVVAQDDTVARPLPVITPSPVLDLVQGEVSGLSQTVYNVKDYGAVGNGSTDDHAAIQGLLDTLVNGETVYFPKGTYMVSEAVRILHRLNIVGEHEKETSIKALSGFTGYYLVCNWAESADPAEAYEAPSSASMPYCHMEHLRLNNGGVAGLTLLGLHDFHEDAYIRDCMFYASGVNAGCRGIYASNFQGGEITGCTQMGAGHSKCWNEWFYGETGTSVLIDGFTSTQLESGASIIKVDEVNHVRLTNLHIEMYPCQDEEADTATLDIQCGGVLIGDCYLGSPNLKPLIKTSSTWGMTIQNVQFGNCYVAGDDSGLLVHNARTLVMADWPTRKIFSYSGKDLYFESGVGGLTVGSRFPSRWHTIHAVFTGSHYYDYLPDEFHIEHDWAGIPDSYDLQTADYHRLWSWRVGDTIKNTAPAAGGYLGWVCVEAGLSHRTSTCTMDSTDTITSVTSYTGWADGDPIKGDGIPDDTTVVSGGGTATLVLSQACTKSQSGITIYDAVWKGYGAIEA